MIICLFIVNQASADNKNDTQSREEALKQIKCPTEDAKTKPHHFEICDAESRVERGVYVLSAHLFYGLSAPAREALNSGVPITLQLRIEILRERSLLWDETVTSISQKYRLHYHTLSQRYVLTNLNSRLVSSYESSEVAMAAISNIDGLPIVESKVIKKSETYYGRIRARLVVSDLPSPLRLWAYMSSDWRLKSEWFQWQL